MILLAIVIPYYKRKYFKQTLQSLAAQTDKRFKVYIGNDASPEPIDDLLAQYKDKLSIQYHFFEQNVGGTNLAGQWHRCLEMLQDEKWFLILGDDDYLSENFVASFYTHIVEIITQNIRVIKYKSIVVDQHNKILQEKKDTPQIWSAWDHFFDKYLYEGRSSLSEHIFLRDPQVSRHFNEMPLAWHSDDLAQLEHSDFGNIFYIKEATCYVHFSADNISGQQSSIAIKRAASAYFYNYLLQKMKHYSKEHLIKFIHLIEWAQKDKGFRADTLPLLKKYYEAFGIMGVIKLLKYKLLA